MILLKSAWRTPALGYGKKTSKALQGIHQLESVYTKGFKDRPRSGVDEQPVELHGGRICGSEFGTGAGSASQFR
jgi:hypothetical protein